MTRGGERKFRKNAQRTYTRILGDVDRERDFKARKANEGTSVTELAQTVTPQRDPVEMARAAQNALHPVLA